MEFEITLRGQSAEELAQVFRAFQGATVRSSRDVDGDFDRTPVAPPVAHSESDDQLESLLQEGEGAFGKLVETWIRNFDVEDSPQPDRPSALMGVFAMHGRAAGKYIRERGGLAGACIDALVRQNLCEPDQAGVLGKKIALNMVQVGSTMAVPLDEFLERSMYHAPRDDEGRLVELDSSRPKPGIAKDTLDFTRPKELPSFAGG